MCSSPGLVTCASKYLRYRKPLKISVVLILNNEITDFFSLKESEGNVSNSSFVKGDQTQKNIIKQTDKKTTTNNQTRRQFLCINLKLIQVNFPPLSVSNAEGQRYAKPENPQSDFALTNI